MQGYDVTERHPLVQLLACPEEGKPAMVDEGMNARKVEASVDISSHAFEEAVSAARQPRMITAGGLERRMYDVSGIPGVERIPRVLVELLENCIRRASSDEEALASARHIVGAGLMGTQGEEIPFMPARVLFQDFTGVPVFVDFAAMRDAMRDAGGDPTLVNPKIPCTLVIDHSVIADEAGSADAADYNRAQEAARNRERFSFLKWAAASFRNVRIVPPGEGICHQLNMERFCEVVTCDTLAEGDVAVACFDTLVGTDSHTTTANGLGVMGWGVGGIEAEAAALGCPISLIVPSVVNLELTGRLSEGVSGMDVALTVAELLRREGVVGSCVEVTGSGVASLTATQRACVANMTPEYGATTTLFPVDERSWDYMRLTGRDEDELAFAQAYLKAQGVYDESAHRVYARTVHLDLSTVTRSLAGPSRPHNRVSIDGLATRFEEQARAHGRTLGESFDVACGDTPITLGHGCIAIAAITSCTTATDPAMMVAAGLLAQKACARGLTPKPWVKKVLAPGSHATQLLLERTHLLSSLEQLGFFTCGFGCMSCIGNSGSIHPSLHAVADTLELTSVLSGNRNFDGRISPDVSQNFLCSPALVVAYSLVGTVDIDLIREPMGRGSDGRPVMLSDLFPSDAEIADALSGALDKELYAEGASGLFEGYPEWIGIHAAMTDTFTWDDASTYIRRPPYFENPSAQESFDMQRARVLAFLGDFVTTDHISPAGQIAPDGPAARYLREHGLVEADFNTFGSRRGNHEVMMRGTFANVKLQNLLAHGKNGGWTYDFLDEKIKSIYDAAEGYRASHTDLLIVAGKMYGSGSSRDWAGKGPALLGVRAVIAESFERIHRSNLVQMGVLPLQFANGTTAHTLGLEGTETYECAPVDLSEQHFIPGTRTDVIAHRADGSSLRFSCEVRVDTPTEAAYLRAGGILPYVLQQLLAQQGRHR